MTILAPFYTGSFAGVGFFEQGSPMLTGRDITSEGSARHTPGAALSSFDDFGASVEPFELTVGVDGAEFAALIVKRGDSGSLIWSRGTMTATLMAILDKPGKAGPYDAYTITLRFLPGTTERPAYAVQLDTATFPAHAITTITDYVLSIETVEDVEADNATCTVTLHTLPAEAAPIAGGVRLYIYAEANLIFNGEVAPGRGWNADGTYTLIGQGTMAKLRRPYGGDDRTYSYNATNPTDPLNDTDTSTVQNLVEASGIDASLTHIEGAGFPIGQAEDVIVRGGTIDVLDPDAPVQPEYLIDLIQVIDRSVVPNHATFETGAGVVTRLPIAIGSSVATFADGAGGNAWGFQVQEDRSKIGNKAHVTGKTIAGVPLQAEASAASSYLVAPWDYQSVPPVESYLIETQDDADDLAAWLVDWHNGIMYTVSWSSRLTSSNIVGKTVTVTSARRELSSQLVYLKSRRSRIDRGGATSSYVAEFRSAP